jgi:hypothetical protein
MTRMGCAETPAVYAAELQSINLDLPIADEDTEKGIKRQSGYFHRQSSSYQDFPAS